MEAILDRALTAMGLRLAKPERVELTCGDLLKIAPRRLHRPEQL